MELIISGTTLEVENYYVERYRDGKLVLTVKIKQDTIEYGTMKDLFVNNTGDITGINSEGKKETLTGFVFKAPRIVDDSEEGTYTVEVTCLGEAEFQIGVMQTQITEQNRLIEEQKALIEKQNNEYRELSGVILEMLMGE